MRQDLGRQHFKRVEDIFLGESAIVDVEELAVEQAGLFELREPIEYLLGAAGDAWARLDRLFEVHQRDGWGQSAGGQDGLEAPGQELLSHPVHVLDMPGCIALTNGV